VNRRFEPYGAVLERPDGASAGGGATKTEGEWVIDVAVRKIPCKKSPNSKKADEEHGECIKTTSEETKEARDCRERYVDKKSPFQRALLALETVTPFQVKCAGEGTVSVKQEESDDMNGLPSSQNESPGGANIVWRFGPSEKEKVSKLGGLNSHGPYGHRSFFDEASDNEEGASPADEDARADEMPGESPKPDVRIEAWEMMDARRSRPVHARDVAQSLGIEAARASIVRVRQMAAY
jgi:hypothetical protein